MVAEVTAAAEEAVEATAAAEEVAEEVAEEEEVTAARTEAMEGEVMAEEIVAVTEGHLPEEEEDISVLSWRPTPTTGGRTVRALLATVTNKKNERKPNEKRSAL